ncbi:unnamed protein product [Lota lota]
MTWIAAQQYCQSNNMTLASLQSIGDVNLLNKMTNGSVQWIGLSDDPLTSRRTINVYPNSWKWSYAYASNYVNFKTGSPSLKFYHLILLPLTWTDSRSYCRFFFIDLAVIETEAENQLMSASLTRAGKTDFYLSWSSPPQTQEPAALKADEDTCYP